jgi:hypothetical protein
MEPIRRTGIEQDRHAARITGLGGGRRFIEEAQPDVHKRPGRNDTSHLPFMHASIDARNGRRLALPVLEVTAGCVQWPGLTLST